MSELNEIVLAKHQRIVELESQLAEANRKLEAATEQIRMDTGLLEANRRKLAEYRTAREAAEARAARLYSLIELIFASTLPYNDGECTFTEKVTDEWRLIESQQPSDWLTNRLREECNKQREEDAKLCERLYTADGCASAIRMCKEKP